MRGVGQALDAVQVGYVVVVRLGQFRAEVAIAFAPDDEGGRLDRAKRRFGQDLRSWSGWWSPCDSLRGWAALRMAIRSTTSGYFIAVAQATLPPQS